LGTPEGGLLSGLGAIAPFTSGTIAGLLSLRDTIEKALEPTKTKTALALTTKAPTPASVTALPPAGTTVTLTTPPAAKAIEAPAPKAAKEAADTSAVAKDSTATDASAPAGTTAGATDVTDGNKVVPGTTGTGATKSGNAPAWGGQRRNQGRDHQRR
jgi:hypothetical protein